VVLIAYTVPAILVWAALGLCLGSLPLSRAALAATALYAACYGITEVTGRLGLPAPGRRWQVPQTMVVGVSDRRRILVWGSILGPGFLTRNPYAGFGLLPLVVATASGARAAAVLAAAIGLAHGAGRGAALLRDAPPRARPPADPMRLVLTSMHWRTLDGFVLLIIAGAAIAACVYLLT
jgi:hypothetical protein